MDTASNEIPTRRSTSRRSTGSLGRCLKEQRGRLYIMWRCTVMLVKMESN
ncbi:hypothetical protein RchiOBHm_Chr6g0291491 [Rosa chinensis]|uniref:Uncharacterized protein n=1 Tax=Rosa chinensis TaxID=74649 RepID=A0A2P6PW68_ROSCH|nr:hypothetical protein RchiOBHm_Chr6g0291491 [Rosa chinensis]